MHWNILRVRPWLNHTDAVKRGIAMSTRLAEIKMEHELNDLDFATMVEAIDDTLPVSFVSSLCHENKLPATSFQLVLTCFLDLPRAHSYHWIG